MTRLVDAGLIVGEPRVFARNELAIVVKAGNPTGIASLADLASADVVALCGRTCRAGGMPPSVDQAGVHRPTGSPRPERQATLAAAWPLPPVTPTPGSSTPPTSSVPTWRRLPSAEVNVIADYPIAVVADAADPTSAEAFVSFVLGPGGGRSSPTPASCRAM
ncbi:MAG: hypothetical protein R2699_10540 [Acidimicrobiales bacterium]